MTETADFQSIVDGVAEAKELDDHGSPGLDQLALATLIESGRYDRHLSEPAIERGIAAIADLVAGREWGQPGPDHGRLERSALSSEAPAADTAVSRSNPPAGESTAAK